MEKIVSLAKRRGFIFPGSEIYGGLAGTWDYGPLGVLMKDNIKRAWWENIVGMRDEVFGVDAAILMNAKVWEASGHVTHFSDPMVDCKKCKLRYRADEILTGSPCANCGVNDFTEAREFQMMFKTHAGPVEDSSSAVYLRPETAQGIFTNFKNVIDTMHPILPFGIAQIGKAFRNEITPGNFLFRSREFEQMELEYFVKPGVDEASHKYWVEERLKWFLDLGINPENIRARVYGSSELAHYAKATTDLEYRFTFAEDFRELEGIANRTDFDLKNHAAASGEDLSYFDEATKSRITPYAIEPSLGLDRAFLAFLSDAYIEEPDKDGTRTVLRLHPRLAPYKAAVFPLLANKPDLVDRAKNIYGMLKPSFSVAWDDIGNIGKRYRRQDEIGTPYCVTVDYETLEDGTATVRDRDSMKQERVPASNLTDYIEDKLKS